MTGDAPSCFISLLYTHLLLLFLLLFLFLFLCDSHVFHFLPSSTRAYTTYTVYSTHVTAANTVYTSSLPPGAEHVSFRRGDDEVCVVARELLVHKRRLGDLRVFFHVVVLGELHQSRVGRLSTRAHHTIHAHARTREAQG